eukprot:c23415_g1_i1 orf=838-2481(+)
MGSASSPDQVKRHRVGKPQRSSQEARRMVKEALVFSAATGVASQPTSITPSSTNFGSPSSVSRVENLAKSSVQFRSIAELQIAEPPKRVNRLPRTALEDGDVVCWESGERNAHWKYVAKQSSGRGTGYIFDVLASKGHKNPLADLAAFVRSCVVPEGYPDSVSPSYAPYMQWRALKYFFGGAMSVFTTQSLLHAVGVSGSGAASTAVAVNWVIKDGAGRIGKMLFARHGKKFDCDMKQLRFRGDLLMELGAGVELMTVGVPHLFLPLACAANIAKNVAAVSSTSTRAPIYKAFARGENIGDVTAKGECISNIADLLGTGLGIFISKSNPSLLAAFMVLSCGYLCCSYQEVKSVLLPTLNSARFGVAVRSFLVTGQVPSLFDGNQKECIFVPPWRKENRLVLGAHVSEAFQTPQTFLDMVRLFEKKNYVVTYNPSRKCVYAVLKEKAISDDVLQAAFHAQLLLHALQKPLKLRKGSTGEANAAGPDCCTIFEKKYPSEFYVRAAIVESCKSISGLYEAFRHQALSKGWIMADSLLNPGNVRLHSWKEG